MDQIITLLTNLFSLTKIAAVTLPGLLAAGGLALIMWPAVPIDVIPVVVAVSRPAEPVQRYDSPSPQSPVVDHSKHPHTAPASTFPQAFVAACRVEHWPPDNNAIARIRQAAEIEQARTQLPNPALEPGQSVPDPSWATDVLSRMRGFDLQSGQQWVPRSRKQHILEQFLLDLEANDLTLCVDTEKSWQGQEEREILQWNSDLDHLEKQRSAAQDNFIAYQKANNSTLTSHYKEDMDSLQDQIDTLRNSIRGQNRDVQERARRITELGEEQGSIAARLADPGRLRPRVGFDAFLTALVSHIVGFILLSLAAAIIVTAIDRAAFGALFEVLFDGF
jgi:hypothetical protein